MSLESTILALQSLQTSRSAETSRVGAPARFLATLVYLVCVLSVPLLDPARLVWLAAVPVVASASLEGGYSRVLRRSLWILPLVALIGIFNPLYDHTAAFSVGSVTVSRGWVTFVSIVLRGVLSMQALIILIEKVGWNPLCAAMGRVGVPRVIVTQLQMVYRYMLVIMQEAQSMLRAMASRGYGRRHYPLRLWCRIIGQLLLRSLERARRINSAMLSRGFTGQMPSTNDTHSSFSLRGLLWLAAVSAACVALRLLPLTNYISHIISHS